MGVRATLEMEVRATLEMEVSATLEMEVYLKLYLILCHESLENSLKHF